MLEEENSDPAYRSLVLRVIVPFKDISNILKSANELSITILDIEFVNSQITIVEFFVNSSYNIYALGKMVAYMELLNNNHS
jgi:hypothetical protein